MQNTPLSSNEHAKLLVFILCMLPTIPFLLVGLIPVLFLSFGLIMMKKHNDFSHIETATQNTIIYIKGISFVAAIIYLILGVYDSTIFGLIFGMASAVAGYGYITALQKLFFDPLESHSEWVAANGIFSITPKHKVEMKNRNVLMHQKHNHEDFRVKDFTDEITKLTQLKESGHITEEEFNKVKNKLFHQI